MNYYISDLHLGHANIIRLCERPFSSVEEMNEVLINNWNKSVKPEDTVYLLGDISFKSPEATKFASSLKGHKILIAGNHDFANLKNPEFVKCFDEVCDMKTIIDGDKKLVLCHYPIIEWDGYFRGVLHLYGHIHNNVRNKSYRIMYEEPNAFNVGAEILGFAPQTLRDTIRMNQEFKNKHPI